MKHRRRPARQLESPLGGGELDAEILLPEGSAPAIMIATHHQDRDPPPEHGQTGHHRQVTPGAARW